MKLKLMAAMTAATLGALLSGGSAEAMNIHVNGRQLYLSGDVTAYDGYALKYIIGQLQQKGVTIDTLVLRDSNGGAVSGGLDVANFARQNGLKTVISGYCISACSMMFVGGTTRAFADQDQPLFNQYIGIHGAHDNAGISSPAYQKSLHQYFLNMIVGGDPSKTDDVLLTDAFEHMNPKYRGQSVAYLWDPAAGQTPSVYWCNQSCSIPAEYKEYPKDDVYNLGFITQKNPEKTTDTLIVNKTVVGNINPNYYNPYDPAVGDFVYNVQPVPGKPGWVSWNYNTDGFVLGDSYGVLRVVKGGDWTLLKDQRAAGEVLWLNGGALHLQGGIVNTTENYVDSHSVLDGHGTLGAATQWARVYVSDGGLIHPTGEGFDVTGNIRLNANAALAIDVTPELANNPAPLRFGLFEGEGYTSMSALSIRNKTSQLALHVSPGFYQPGQKYALVGYSADVPAQLADAAKTKTSPSSTNVIVGSFTHLLRADATGTPMAGYDIDPTTADSSQAAFHPFDGSLINYQLIQQGNGIWLQANNPFADLSLCGPAGCGLGQALGAAAQARGNGLQPLLGALEFANGAQAARAAGQLRGESYGSLRTASLSLLGNFSGVLNQHLRAANPDADQAAHVAFAAAAPGMGLDNPRRSGDLSAMMSYLVANDEASGSPAPSSDGPSLWGRLFGNRGHLDSSNGVAALRQHSVGVMLGLDKQITTGTVIGGSLGYGKLRAEGEGNGFSGRVRALDARFYVDYRYDRGYLNAVVGYTRLRNTTSRYIDLPLYAAQANARYDGNAFSLHLEHGWTLRDRHDVVWQPILPSIDLVRLPGLHFADQGAGAAGLNVDAKHVTDTRVGVGLQVYKTFAWNHDGELTPHARLLLQHRFSAHENTFMADLQGYPQGVFEVRSQREGLNHALVNLGMSARRGSRMSFTLDYLGDFAKRHRDQGVMLGARYRW